MLDKNFNILRVLPIIFAILFIVLPLLGKMGGFIIPLLLFLLFSGILDRKLIVNIINNLQNKKTEVDSNENVYNYEDINNKFNNMNPQNIKRNILTAVVAVFGLWLFFASVVVIGAGEIGVYSLFGRISDQELKSGFHLVIPLARIDKMSIRTEEYTMSIVSNEGTRAGNDSITALTKEGLTIGMDLTALYHVQEDKASDIYKNIGLTYDEKIIRPVIRTAIRDVVAGYDAKDIYSAKRAEVGNKIKDNIQTDLNNRGVILEELMLRDVRLPDNLAKSIQEKLQAEQESQKYDFLLEKEKKEKQRKVIEAEGQRDAQKIINESLSTNYLYYQYINSLKDRQGTVYVTTSPTTGMPTFKELGK